MTKEISPELKAKILEESRDSRCVISELANRYKIKVDQIYRWRRNDRSKKAVSAQPRANSSNFVEAKLEESDFEDRKNILIKKASLEFEDFKLSIEGSLKGSKVKEIMELLC